MVLHILFTHDKLLQRYSFNGLYNFFNHPHYTKIVKAIEKRYGNVSTRWGAA